MFLQPIGTLLVVELQPGEQRLRHPFVEERVDADIDDVVGQLVVRRSALGAFALVGDAGDAPIDGEPATSCGYISAACMHSRPPRL